MFGPGAANAAQISPFFFLPAGATPGTTSITVNFSGDALLGPGAHIESTVDTTYGRFDADYELTDTWSVNAGFLVGLDSSRQQNFGQMCGSCFNLAINGTTNGGGSTTAPSIPGQSTVVLNTPLTTANSLDPFGAGTSAAVLTTLTDSGQIQVGDQTIKNFYFKFDGDLFSMRGGDAQLAVGGELIDYQLDQDIVRSNNTGPASTGSAQLFIPYSRDVKSAYAELYLPFVGPEQDIPALHSFALNLSTRHDDYSDVGSHDQPEDRLELGHRRSRDAARELFGSVRRAGAHEPRRERRRTHRRVGILRHRGAGSARWGADDLDRELSVRDRHPRLPARVDDVLA